jgi:hypothetical protein
MKGISPIVTELVSLVVNYLQQNYDGSDFIQIDKNNLNYYYSEFDVDQWNINFKDYNSYNHSKSGYKNSKYIVYINLDINNIIIDSLIHEFKHAYVDWCIFKNGGVNINKTKEIKELYTEDFEKLILDENITINDKLIKYYYFGSKLEIPSFLENHFFDETFVNYREITENMINFDLKEDLSKEFKYINENYDIPLFRKFKSYYNFLDYSKNYFNKRGNYILKKIKRIDKLKLNNFKDIIDILNKTKITDDEWLFVYQKTRAIRSNIFRSDKCFLLETSTKNDTDIEYYGFGEKKVIIKPGDYFNYDNYFFIPNKGFYEILLKSLNL